MDVEKINYFEKVEHDGQQEFIESQNHCALCGTVLELNHFTDKISSEIKEEARCPECEIRTRARIHPLN